MKRWLQCAALTLLLPLSPSLAGEALPIRPFPLETFARRALPKGEKILKAHPFRSEHISIHTLRIAGKVAEHYHAHHDEMVMIYEGTGILQIEGEANKVQAGDVVLIPQGTRHAFVNRGEDPCTLVSSISPPFDGKDRVWVGVDQD